MKIKEWITEHPSDAAQWAVVILCGLVIFVSFIK